jgi:cytochrome c553
MAADLREWGARRVMRLAFLLLAAGLLLTPAPGRAASLEERLAVCAACHGEKGIAVLPEAPSLAGQPVLYTQIQLFLFREGQRVNAAMNAAAQDLTDDELTALAEWYAKQPPQAAAAPAADAALDARGRELAVTHRCGTCHLPDYSGRDQIPRIAAQAEAYLLQALRDYKGGARSGDGAQMAEVVYALSEDDMKALAHHISHYK